MGRDKALLERDGVTLLERTVCELQTISEDVIVVGRAVHIPGVRGVPDERRGLGPIGGLLTGLRLARCPLVIAVACDHPFLDARALNVLVSLASGYEAVVPSMAGIAQPLHAVYRRTSIPTVEAYVAGGGRSLNGLLEKLSIRWVTEAEMAEIDPDHRSLLNVNTPEEWRRARSRSAGNRGSIG